MNIPIEPRQGCSQDDVDGCERHQDQRRARRHDVFEFHAMARERTGLQFSRATFRISMELVPPGTPDSSPLVRITRSFFFTSCSSSSRVNNSRYRTSCELGDVTSNITGY